MIEEQQHDQSGGAHEAANTEKTPADADAIGSSAMVWNRSEMLERLAIDEALIDDLVEAFLEDMPQHIDALREALRQEDASNATLHAHTIKGTAANMGGEQLRMVAYEMEQAAKAGDLAVAATRLPHLDEQFSRLKNVMREQAS